MKLKYAYSFQKYDDRYLAVVDFTETETERRMIWVNETGKAIMELLQTDMTKEELTRALTERYAGDAELMGKAAEQFTGQLSAAGLLENA